METYNNVRMYVKMYSDEALSHTQIFRWHNNFKNCGESVGDKDEPRSGRSDEARTDNNVQCRVRTTRADRQPTFLPKSTRSAAKTSHWCPFGHCQNVDPSL